MARGFVGMLALALVNVACGEGRNSLNARSDTLRLQAPDAPEGVMYRDQATPWDSLREIVYPPLPDGYKRHVGMMIGNNHGMSEINRANETFLILSRLREYTPSGRALWEVEAALRLPPTREGESIVWVDCSVDGLVDATVVAIGEWQSSALADSLKWIRQAWRPDTTTATLEFINPSRVACVIDEDRR